MSSFGMEFRLPLYCSVLPSASNETNIRYRMSILATVFINDSGDR